MKAGCQTLLAEIESTAAEFEGEISVAARDLRSGDTVNFHSARRCPTASVIKLPILVHTLLLSREGLLDLDAPLEVTPDNKTPGSGVLSLLSPGFRISIRDACALMIAVSDNTATNLILDRVGIEPVNERLRGLGLRDTTLFRKVFSKGAPVSAANHKYGLGVTTARDMLCLLTQIHGGRVGGAETSEQIRAILAKQQHRESIPRLLPHGARFEGKSGAVDAVRNDVGIVTLESGGQFALAVFCHKIPRPLWTADNPGHLAIARIARAAAHCFESSCSSAAGPPV